MESAARKKARTFVVVGFALIAVGSIINVIRGVTSVGYFSLASSLTLFQLVLSPLVGLAAVWSWWWLSRIRVDTSEQASFVRRGFYGLALQNTISTAMVLALLFQVPTLQPGFVERRAVLGAVLGPFGGVDWLRLAGKADRDRRGRFRRRGS